MLVMVLVRTGKRFNNVVLQVVVRIHSLGFTNPVDSGTVGIIPPVTVHFQEVLCVFVSFSCDQGLNVPSNRDKSYPLSILGVSKCTLKKKE